MCGYSWLCCTSAYNIRWLEKRRDHALREGEDNCCQGYPSEYLYEIYTIDVEKYRWAQPRMCCCTLSHTYLFVTFLLFVLIVNWFLPGMINTENPEDTDSGMLLAMYFGADATLFALFYGSQLALRRYNELRQTRRLAQQRRTEGWTETEIRRGIRDQDLENPTGHRLQPSIALPPELVPLKTGFVGPQVMSNA